MRVDLVDQTGLVAAFRQENPNQLDDLVTRQNEPGIAAAGVELRELLAEQGQQEAYRKDSGRRATRRGSSGSPSSTRRERKKA